MYARSSTWSAGARPSHFDDTQVTALMLILSDRGTTTPVPSSGCLTACLGYASAVVTTETDGMRAHA